MSDSSGAKPTRYPRRRRPALPATRSTGAAPAERAESAAAREARVDAALQKLQAANTLGEIIHGCHVLISARGPRYQKHPSRQDGILFRGTAKEHQARLLSATGSTDFYLANQLISEVASTRGAGEPELARLNSVGPVLSAVAPRTPLEGLLAAQMAAVHGLAMRFLCLAAGANQTETIDATTGAANRLLRTFTLQLEALTRLRSPGITEQRVVVQHVTVADGGQAVIGAVSRAGGEEGGR